MKLSRKKPDFEKLSRRACAGTRKLYSSLANCEGTSNSPIYKDLEFESVKIIADNCKNLTEINFYGSFGSRGFIDSERSIRYLVENITENIEKIDLGRVENIDDDDVHILAQRFYELENI